jgi:hypothetical protein
LVVGVDAPRDDPNAEPANAPSAAGTAGLGVGIEGCNACNPLPRAWEAAAAVAVATADDPLLAADAADVPANEVGTGPAFEWIGVAVGRDAVVTVMDH